MNSTSMWSHKQLLRAALVFSTVAVATLAVLPGVAGADPPAIPDAPTNVTTGPYTQGDNFVQVNWTASNLANPPVSLYTVTSSPGGLTCTTNGAVECTVQNLVAGTDYTFTVVGTNDQGSSSPSKPSVGFTPTQVPGPPEGLTINYTQGTTSFTADWSAPTTGYPALTSYQVTLNPGGNTQTLGPTVTEADFTGLTAGTSYTVGVAGVNAVGTGTLSTSAPVTVTGIPGPVTNPTAGYLAGTSGITVTWGVPTTGYPTPTSYTVTSSDGTTCTSATLSCTFTSLTPGQTYTFSVTATNSVGTGPSATTNSVTVSKPPSTPGAPTFPALKANTTKVSLSWAPSSGCGSGCTYAVLANGTKITSTSTTHQIVSGLAYGTSYVFTVTATSATGTSNPSSASKPATAWRTFLRAGATLPAGQRLYSANRAYYLEILSNGHLSVSRASRAYWTAPGGTGTSLTVSTTGNVIFSNGSTRVWSSKTSLGHGTWILEISSVGARDIYNGSRLVWRSNGGLVRKAHAPKAPTKRPVTTTTVRRTTPTTTTTVPGVPLP
jgi:predicted phage tail protein